MNTVPLLSNATDWMSGIEVRVAPMLLRSSNTVAAWSEGRHQVVLVWSLHAAQLILRGVQWHDEADHCRTWSAGCRCDLGDEA